MQDIARFPLSGDAGPLQKFQHIVQLLPPVEVILLRQAQVELARLGVGQAVALPHGVHTLSDTI